MWTVTYQTPVPVNNSLTWGLCSFFDVIDYFLYSAVALKVASQVLDTAGISICFARKLFNLQETESIHGTNLVAHSSQDHQLTVDSFINPLASLSIAPKQVPHQSGENVQTVDPD